MALDFRCRPIGRLVNRRFGDIFDRHSNVDLARTFDPKELMPRVARDCRAGRRVLGPVAVPDIVAVDEDDDLDEIEEVEEPAVEPIEQVDDFNDDDFDDEFDDDFEEEFEDDEFGAEAAADETEDDDEQDEFDND